VSCIFPRTRPQISKSIFCGTISKLTRLVSVGLILAGALSVHAPAANAQSGRLKALIGGTLVDGFGGKPIRDSIVIIHGERIKTVGTIGALPVPKEAEVISTEGMSVMPDCGTWHVGIQTVLYSRA